MQRLTRTAIASYWENISKRVEECALQGNIRGMYAGIKEALGPVPKKTAPLKTTSGETLTDLQAQLNRWVEHYQSLYANEVHALDDAIKLVVPSQPIMYELDYPVSLEEVNKAIHGLKSNKSPGADGIPPEVLKSGGLPMIKEVHRLITTCWSERCIPQDLKDANIITLYKNKGDRSDCNNYHGISLLSLVGKTLARVLLPRLQKLANRILPESQCGFRPSCSTIDMVFSLKQIQEKCVEQQRPLYIIFVDLTKAFDYVSRSGLFLTLKQLGCPETLMDLLVGFHNNMTATVQFNGSRSKNFDIRCGVKQGCVLAPTLFAVYFSALLRRAFPTPSGVHLHTRSSGKLFNLARLRAKTRIKHVMIRELLYADDAAFIAHTEAEVQAMCDAFSAACDEFGLKISISKTVVLAQNTPSIPNVTINGSSLEVVRKFTYLGSTISDDNSLDNELDIRIGRASTTFGRLQSRVWSNRHLSLKLKVRVYMTCVLSVLLYGSESWPAYRWQEHRLNAFHMRCLRSIMGVSWQDRIPNTVVLEQTGAPDMYTLLRQQRLRWTGHVIRMEDSRIPKAVLYRELAVGKRPVGRPRLRYRDVIRRDLKDFNVNIEDWESHAHDRLILGNHLRTGAQHSEATYHQLCEERRERRHRSDRRLRLNRP